MTDNGDTIMAGGLAILGNALQVPTGGLRNKGIIVASHAAPTDKIVVRMAKRLKPSFAIKAKRELVEIGTTIASGGKKIRLTHDANDFFPQLQDFKVGKTKFKFNGDNFSTDNYQAPKRRTTTRRVPRRTPYTRRKSYRSVRPQAKTYRRRWPVGVQRGGRRVASRPYARTARTYGRWTFGTARRSRRYSSRRRRMYY